MCSTDSTAQQGEKQSLQFQNTLTDAFTKQYGAQSDILGFLKQNMTDAISNPQGYDQGTLNGLKTNATDTIASQYAKAKQSLQNQQFTTGGEDLPSGVNEMQQGTLAQGQARDTSGAMQNIDLQNANLKQTNYWNAVNSLSGVASQYNPNGTASNANGAGSTTASLSNAVTNSQAQGMSPLTSLISAGAGVGAAALYGGKKTG